MPSSRPRASALLSLLALACAGGGPSPESNATPAASVSSGATGQLARFAGLRVMVLPTQGTLGGDSLGWRAKAGGEREMLRLIDGAIEAALGERGLSTQWVFPPAMARSAKRNPTYVTDPYAMRALIAVRAALRKPQDPVGEPFASQLRALAGVSDARYALVPIDVWLEPSSSGGARAVLRAAIFDVRGSQLVWAGGVSGDRQREYSATLYSDLAQRVADLVVPR